MKGKVAVVTGGGSGIGKMMAMALVTNGAKVYIASRKLEVVAQVAKELTRMGPGSCFGLQADLSGKKAAVDLAAQIASKEDRIHVLINNSGMSWGSSLSDFDEQNGWDRLMALNVKAVFYLTAALVPLLAKGADGNIDPARVINVSSVAAVQSNAETPLSGPGMGIWSYAASKAAVNQLTRVLSSSLSPENIVVNAIAPGVFPSRMTKFGIDSAKDLMDMAQPLGRIGSTADMAGLTLFLCSRSSAHINGAIIPIDGGATLGLSAAARL